MNSHLNLQDKQTFPKEERLSSKKDIQELFDKGSSFYLYPFKVIYLTNPDESVSRHQVLVSVSKKKFKRAVDRNLIKRRMRESYRLNKHILYSDKGVKKPLLIAYIYTGKQIHPFRLMENKLMQSCIRLVKETEAK